MAQLPKDVTVTVSVDTDLAEDKITQVKQVLEAYGKGLSQVAEQMKPAITSLGEGFSKIAMQFQLAKAFDVPPEILGLEAIHASQDTDLLAPDECPKNLAPYYEGDSVLGANTKLVHQFQSPTGPGWEGKTSEEIVADIQAAIAAYKGKVDVPHKTFKAPDDPLYGPAHQVFTSPLIHSHAEVKAKAQELLAQHGVVKTAQLDEQGNPTGAWITLGAVTDFPNLETLMTPEQYKVSQGFTASEQPTVMQVVSLQEAQAQADAEIALIGTHIGVDLTKDSGNTAVVWTDEASKMIMVDAIGPDGEVIKHAGMTFPEAQALVQKAMSEYPPLLSYGTPWAKSMKIADLESVSEDEHGISFTAKVAPVSNHALGLAMDHNGITASGGYIAPPDHMHFDVPDISSFKFPEVSVQKGGAKFPKFPKWPLSEYVNPKTGASYTEVEEGVFEVVLTGSVPSGKGFSGVIQQTHIFPKDQAEQVCGQKPLTSHFLMPSHWVGGVLYTWDPAKGWSDTAVSTVPDLFAEEKPPGPAIHPQGHLWCTACEVHWLMHTGDPIACDSGGHLRPSTPVEDKAVLIKIRIMADGGLLPKNWPL